MHVDNSSVEQLNELIQRLTAERQELRFSAAPAERLEANRIELVRAQWNLSRALIRRHYPAAA